jgi:periplasmic divalent cation tolerance protein
MAIMVGTTVSSMDEAKQIAAACVKGGIAACAHIDEIKSMFFWDGEVKDGTEYRVFLKTVDASYAAISDVIENLHSYDEPAIFCIPITHGSGTYLQWIEDNSTAKA